MSSFLSINPKDVSTKDFHAYLLSSIAPRPIAFASTIDREGNVNLSPFSFFNVFGSNPPTLIFSPNKRVRDGSGKDTLYNVNEVDEVVINMVDFEMVEQMSLASCEYPKGTNEFKKAGFTEAKSHLIKPPRVAEAKVAFECKIKQIISMGEQGGAANLIICEVVMAHVSEDLLDETGKIDPTKTDWVARMGGDWYCRASGAATFEIPKPNVHLGVGVDAIPEKIIASKRLSGNELGRLGNANDIPSDEEAAAFKALNVADDYIVLARNLLSENRIKEAWMAIKIADLNLL